MNNSNPIGIFDSGIGGATVLKEIIKILPQENYIYYSDSKNNPYGDKNKEKIIELSEEIVEFFIKKQCKIIVIACNTASAIAVAELRNKYPNMVFIAIEPAYKMVFDYAKDGETLVMATKGTLESEKFNLLYHKYDNHKTYLLPCIGLADIIENGDNLEILKYLENHLKEYKGNIKNVVLGCTHYPLVKKEIQQTLGNVKFFDGSSSLAKHLKDILEYNELINKGKGSIRFIDSANNIEKEKRFYKYLENEENKKESIKK